MGLDMYLRAEKYVSQYYDEDKPIISAVAGAIPSIADKQLCGITIEAAYWRKANHIHAWFVQNCQDGVDECQRAPVSREQLRDLLVTVNQVLDDRSRAAELLPTQNGFFFGGTDYDEYYFADLEYTKKTLTGLLDDKFREWDFHYQSSW